MAQLAELLGGLLSSTNETRQAAENAFTEHKKNPEPLIAGLCEAVQTLGGGEQTLGAVLIKDIIQDKKAYALLSPQGKVSLQGALLSILSSVDVKPVRRAIETAVSIMGCSRLVKENNGWPELLPALFQTAVSGSEAQQISAVNILSAMAASLDDEGMTKQVGETLLACLNGPSLPVRLAAVKTATNYILQLEDAEGYRCLLPPIMNTVAMCIPGHEEAANEVLESLTEILEGDAAFIIGSGHLPAILEAAFAIAANTSLGHPLRQRSADLMVAFIQEDPRMAKKQASAFLDKLVALMISFMQTVSDDDPDWGNTQEDDDDDEEFAFHDMGASALDSIARSIGGNVMEKIASPKILALVNDENKGDWRNRHACIEALSYIAEGCKKKFASNLFNLTQLILSHFTDVNAKVRYAAVRAISQFCVDFSPEFQGTFHDSVLKAILGLLADPVPRVRHIAASTLINFCENAIPQLYEDKIEGLLGQLYKMLDDPNEKLFVKEAALMAVSGICENIESRFLKYYDTFMRVVQVILSIPDADETNNTIKIKALECASFIAISCGKDRFFQGGEQSEGKKILDYAMNLTLHIASDDTRVKYLPQIWMRLVEVSQERFQPYLPILVKQLCGQLSNATDLELLDGDQEVTDKNVETFVLGVRGEGERKFAVHTSIVDDKEMILEIFRVLFSHLSAEMMSPHIKEMVDAFLPETNHLQSSEVRDSAAGLCPLVMKCAKARVDAGAAPPTVMTDLMREFFPRLLDTIQLEQEVQTLSSIIKHFIDTIAACSKDCFDLEQQKKLLQAVAALFEESLTRCAVLNEDHKENHEDEDEQEKIQEKQEDEEELLIQTSELLGKLMSTQTTFVQHFVQYLLPQVSSMCDLKKYGPLGVRLALCIFCDLVEYGKELAMPYYHKICSDYWQYAEQNPGCGQVCCYGLNVAVTYGASIQNLPGSPGFPQDFFPKTLATLRKTMKHKDEEWEAAVCNAVSGLLTIAQHFNGQPGINEAEILQEVCQRIPVGGDELEARNVHARIFDYVKLGNEAVVGPNKCNLPAIKAIAHSLLKEHMEDDSESRLKPETCALITELFGPLA